MVRIPSRRPVGVNKTPNEVPAYSPRLCRLGDLLGNPYEIIINLDRGCDQILSCENPFSRAYVPDSYPARP